MGIQNTSLLKKQKVKYLPRGRNTLHEVFERHFTDFCSRYDEEYADTFGKFRLERIQTVGEHFLTCGDYRQGIARIRCTNPECGYDYFRPFSCKGFYLCPSCSQKRTLLFAEHLNEEVLLRLPHRQFVFTFPKALRVFFPHDRKLFAEISKMIFAMISDFYREVAGKEIRTGMVIAHQTFRDMLRFNPHFHAILLEGGFDEDGTFVYLPFSGLEKMTDYFRRTVLGFFNEKKLLTEQFARNLLSWKQSGFSVDNSVRILDGRSRENLAQYLARPPVSLKKIHYEGFKGRVLFHTHYNEYFKGNVHMFNACDFLAELTQHIPPKGVQLIRRYGLYSSRTKGTWESMPHVAERAPAGWKIQHESQTGTANPEDFETFENTDFSDDSPDTQAYRKAWARLLSKFYEIDPMVCPKCGSEMKVIAVIQEPEEIKRILRHLVKQGRTPPGLDPTSLN